MLKNAIIPICATVLFLLVMIAVATAVIDLSSAGAIKLFSFCTASAIAGVMLGMHIVKQKCDPE